MARELIAINQTMCHSWSLVYRQAPPQNPHLLLQHLHHWILYLTAGDTPKIQDQKEVEVRVKSYGESHCINPQKPKTKNRNEGHEEVQSDLLHDLPDWLQEFREKLVDECSPSETQETLRLMIKTLPVLLMRQATKFESPGT